MIDTAVLIISISNIVMAFYCVYLRKENKRLSKYANLYLEQGRNMAQEQIDFVYRSKFGKITIKDVN